MRFLLILRREVKVRGKIYNIHLDLYTEFVLPTHDQKQGKRDINIETAKENNFFVETFQVL